MVLIRRLWVLGLLAAEGARAAPEPVDSIGPVAPGATLTLRRPRDCRARRPRSDLRVLLDCRGEDRVRFVLGAAGEPEPLTATAEPVVVPSELAQVFRSCPFEAVAALDAEPDRFIAYEDRDVGRCYLYAPLDRAALATLGRYDARDHLATLHPFLAAVTLRMLAEAAAAGHRFRVISGVRAGGKPSWHTFGLAVDVNIAGRKGLREATRAYLRGGSEAEAWRALAAVGERLGLYWLGRRDPDEIFHFEWRPGWTGLPRGEVARELGADVARAGPPAVWRRLRFDATRPTALSALRDPRP
jgi:hypothetical protein